MGLNADFSQRAAVHAAGLPWMPSPTPGVARRMLDRIGAEVARATTIVRYAPGSHFSAHTHDGGEEILVLEGVFSDERGDYPVGTYIRNPPTSHHTPGSDQGCTIFVKLWQFDLNDRTGVRIDTGTRQYLSAPGRPGAEVMPLFRDDREDVRLERWMAGTEIVLPAPGGMEILVLEGDFIEGGETFEWLGWLRLPAGSTFRGTAGACGAKLWMKAGHLARVQTAPAPGA
ncbi:MAG: cupin domain-containing protein [Acidiferrobacterales bacterium]